MRIFFVFVLILLSLRLNADPVDGLLERIDKGASKKFKIELVRSDKDDKDFFELDQAGEQVVIRGNNYVSIATGLNWYLKYYANVHLSWNNMTAALPAVLPAVKKPERRETTMRDRYDLNYCTYSYSMAFWDWERWQQEIDWMALHGVNMPLALTGTEVVWYNVLKRMGYAEWEIDKFIAGPGFLAWWLMNNLEGWGGPNPENWYSQQAALQKKIITRMREFDIEPVLPGYAGMVPNNAKEMLGFNVVDPGTWCGFRRPAFLQPTDPNFELISSIYYEELGKLYGKAKYYSIDPFHEGGNTEGVDLDKAGKAIMGAMKKANPDAVWVIQGWQANPRPAMVDNLEEGDLLALDLFSESRPMWGDTLSPWCRKNGYGKHDWLYCMLLNYGGNVGFFGKMDRVINGFYMAKQHPNGKNLKGVGATMEGIENNPVMYELLFELPWRADQFTKEEWLKGYTKARYGKEDSKLNKAWDILANTVYACPAASTQEGTTESVLCARPTEEIGSVSSWGSAGIYYDPAELQEVAELMLSVANKYKGNNNFEYDLVDVVRQTLADRSNSLHKEVIAAYRAGDKALYAKLSTKFLELVLLQDKLLSTRPEFMLGTWLERAKALGQNKEEKQLYEWNARTQITTWGDRNAADNGGLRDYSHREWAGLLKDFYYMRWKLYFSYLANKMEGKNPVRIDFYAIEEAWTKQLDTYPVKAQGEVVTTAKEVYKKAMSL